MFTPYDHVAYACTQEIAALQQEFGGATRGQAMACVRGEENARGSMIVHAAAGSLEAKIEQLGTVATAFVGFSHVPASGGGGGDDVSQSW